MKMLSLKIHGNVHGVFYRHAVWEKAKELNLRGYVKNMPDKTVEVKAVGEPEILEDLLEYCRKNPGLSQVEDIEAIWDERDPQSFAKEFDDFKVLHQ
ncbi:MAG: hypothetical protein A2445_04810 [Candidatus Jacksonbacteria bacterium RIFOXYC2_FULL_44_29]|nr:MAG: Acylphosphatase [Parcubacteria group bacterium GW2011_GWC2_44_22]OGY75181.1 MAG: hypothetical protein A2240_01095 [Candidatus Jacksonbacteria bacterium RIFOXYA2_FULL_43_12]OGY75644.1 MAG: hypothetical protein A2295_04690 [Candidatus Jacksonbacteria bacterium RIFOXYB2_FULL_44_15]OGY77788.1 MAG: hypothetical protein A2445_04810 [Candidatus Jacksonbacteria bacterium RIFOXYC2_FULL_44_29]OGY79517.1 MAG: hypothetical protein A2550_02100 [Candidatus Jacksonbacteria bacterium RIFOXYD2_FULL_43_2